MRESSVNPGHPVPRLANRPCVAPDCDATAEPGAPLPLCRRHFAVAADWAGQEFGAQDVLPSPCIACGGSIGVRLPSGWVCATCEWTYGRVPDDELPPPRVEVVYYIRFDDRMKIGTTSNLRQRMSRIWHEELVALEPGGRAREQARHAQFAALRLGRTEWFALEPELVAHVDALRLGVDDPWRLYARWLSRAAAALA